MKTTATLAGLVLLIVAVLSGPAVGAIKIRRVFFDPPGSDTGSSSSLRNEYVVIANTGNHRKDLSGWKLHDEGRNHTYSFNDFEIRSGAVVRVRTGSGNDDRHDKFWGLDNYVWNNDGDTAFLKTRNGNVVDQCGYPSTEDSPAEC